MHLDAAPPRARRQEIPEAKAEILEVDLAVAVMVQVGEDDVTVPLDKASPFDV